MTWWCLVTQLETRDTFHRSIHPSSLYPSSLCPSAIIPLSYTHLFLIHPSSNYRVYGISIHPSIRPSVHHILRSSLWIHLIIIFQFSLSTFIYFLLVYRLSTHPSVYLLSNLPSSPSISLHHLLTVDYLIYPLSIFSSAHLLSIYPYIFLSSHLFLIHLCSIYPFSYTASLIHLSTTCTNISIIFLPTIRLSSIYRLIFYIFHIFYSSIIHQFILNS